MFRFLFSLQGESTVQHAACESREFSADTIRVQDQLPFSLHGVCPSKVC